jgi:hypothetical protein
LNGGRVEPFSGSVFGWFVGQSGQSPFKNATTLAAVDLRGACRLNAARPKTAAEAHIQM